MALRGRTGRRKNFRIGLLIGCALVVAYQASVWRNPDSVGGMPAAEQNFVAAALDARAAWVDAPNDLAKSGMPGRRAAALCEAVPGLLASGWRGSVLRIDPDNFPDFAGRKTARIVIALASHVTVSTPAAPLLNDPATMVEAGSAIYATAATLRRGQDVVFSGTFFGDGGNCVTEESLTEDGSMTDPRFKIRLTALAAK